jgi:SAM-dependent methyltransferase
MPPYNPINFGDLLDLRNRLWQRRTLDPLGKIFKHSLSRTAATFDHKHEISIWNMIPAVRQRLNELATGNPECCYEKYVIDHYLANKMELSLLSIGCGTASHELFFARNGPFKYVHGIDLAPALIASASKQAASMKLDNTHFEVKNFLTESFDQHYDVVLFHQSLHHFEDFRHIMGTFLPSVLKKNGMLVINEFVGPTRLQWTHEQLIAANASLNILPKDYRRIFKTSFYKNKIYRPGIWRMLASDPSESIKSADIMVALHEHLTTIEEKALGGNLLHLVLKDIAHHFCDRGDSSAKLLQNLFNQEDIFLKRNPSDFIFGIYRL